MGICASGGYAITAAATDHRVRAVATVSAVDIGRQFRMGADGTQDPNIIRDLLDNAAAARSAEARGESSPGLSLFPDSAEQALALGGRHGLEGFEYYRTDRARHPRSARTFTWPSIDKIASFDAFGVVDLIAPRPLLMVVGHEAVTAWMSIAAFQNAQYPKELHWIEGASHNDLYDIEQYVRPAVEQLTTFFSHRLRQLSSTPAPMAAR
ncbi:hypothetical protein GCM10027068_20940 [Prescottella soli]